MMQIDQEERRDVVVVTMDGPLVAGVGDTVLRDTMNRLVADRKTKILLDLSKVERIDSSGIGELVDSHRMAERFGADVRLLNLQGQVLRILELSQLLPLFRVHQGEDEALAAFEASGDSPKVFDT